MNTEQRLCVHCGKSLAGMRVNRKTCSDRCRTAAYRVRKAAREAAEASARARILTRSPVTVRGVARDA